MIALDTSLWNDEVASSLPLFLALTWTWALDGWIVVVGALAAIASALLGNFLLLRRMSMLGDAISHAVLPGIVVAFLVTQTRSPLPMFLGAIVAGILTASFTEWIRGFGGVDEDASMGVVFTTLFAIGLVLLVQTSDSIDLDTDCVLYGALEATTLDSVLIAGWQIPRAALTLTVIVMINAAFVTFFFKELKITSFDPALATTMGISAKWMHYTLMVLVSMTAVACFESVGSILVVAMFVVPAAAAYMLTDRLVLMIGLSVLIAASSAAGGHVMAITVPSWFGYGSTTTAGMIAVAAGGLFTLAAALGPRHGVVVKWLRRQLLSLRIVCDDIVATLYRREEPLREAAMREPAMREPAMREADAGVNWSENLFRSKFSLRVGMMILRWRGEIEGADNGISLTDLGRRRAQRLVRSHRLWEQYLVDHAGSTTEQIHGQAERFEHFTDRSLRDELARETDAPDHDPHGSPIPDEH